MELVADEIAEAENRRRRQQRYRRKRCDQELALGSCDVIEVEGA